MDKISIFINLALDMDVKNSTKKIKKRTKEIMSTVDG